MNIAQALKQKNSLICEINDLKETIKNYNVYQASNAPEFDTKKLMIELNAKVINLIQLKAKISNASVAISRLILTISESKGLIAFLKEIDTTHGVQHIKETWKDSPKEINNIAQIRKADVNSLIKELVKEIEKAQEEIDVHNATITI